MALMPVFARPSPTNHDAGRPHCAEKLRQSKSHDSDSNRLRRLESYPHQSIHMYNPVHHRTGR